MDITKKAAEILVECGYGSACPDIEGVYVKKNNFVRTVLPFTDTLEGRRQAYAIEDWLALNGIWRKSFKAVHVDMKISGHQWRLDRIKWCLEKLSNRAIKDAEGE